MMMMMYIYNFAIILMCVDTDADVIVAAVLIPIAVVLIVVLLLLAAVFWGCRAGRENGYTIRYALYVLIQNSLRIKMLITRLLAGYA